MFDKTEFHGLIAWFAPEYESAYAPVWRKCGGRIGLLEDAHLAVLTDTRSNNVRMVIKILKPDKVEGSDGTVQYTYDRFKQVFPALRHLDPSMVGTGEGRSTLDTKHTTRFIPPPRPTLRQFSAVTPFWLSRPFSSTRWCNEDDRWHELMYSGTNDTAVYVSDGSRGYASLNDAQARPPECETTFVVNSSGVNEQKKCARPQYVHLYCR